MYTVVWSYEALDDFERLHVRHQRVVRAAAQGLCYSPTAHRTTHRKPLTEPLDELPDLTWELRVGAFRVLFSVDEVARNVLVLRVILKGRWTTAESLRRSRRS